MSSQLQPTSFSHGLGLHSSFSQGIQQNINLGCKQNSFVLELRLYSYISGRTLVLFMYSVSSIHVSFTLSIHIFE